MKKFLLLALMLPSLAFGHGAPVIWDGTVARWLPGGLKSAGLCSLSSTGVMTSRTLVSGDIPNNAANTSGNAATATALAANPTDCGAGEFASAIAASGNLTCSVPVNTTGNAATATALAANPADCGAGEYAVAIAANGDLTCAAVPAGDHGALTGLSDDDHAQYLLLAGRSGGQSAAGGTASGDDLTLSSTTHGTKGNITIGANMTIVPDGSIAMGSTSATSTNGRIHIKSGGNYNQALTFEGPAGGFDADTKWYMYADSGSMSWFVPASGESSIAIANSGRVKVGTGLLNYLFSYGRNSTNTTLSTLTAADNVMAIGNGSSTANNFSGIVFEGGSFTWDSGIFGVHDDHTAAAESGHLEFWTKNAGVAVKKMNISTGGNITFNAYGAGIAHLNASGVMTSSAVDLSGSEATGTLAAARMPALTGDITTSAGNVATTYAGTVPLNKGGTGQTTKAAAFDALSPMSASGDIIYGGASGTGTRLAKGSDGQVLTLASGVPSWAAGGGSVATDEVFVSVGNGSGSTNTKIRRFSVTDVDTSGGITYADSSTNGGSFTVGATGRYSITYGDQTSAGPMNLGISVNGSALTTSIPSVTYAQGYRGYVTTPGASAVNSHSILLDLTSGDVVRAHHDGQADGAVRGTYFHISRVN